MNNICCCSDPECQLLGCKARRLQWSGIFQTPFEYPRADQDTYDKAKELVKNAATPSRLELAKARNKELKRKRDAKIQQGKDDAEAERIEQENAELEKELEDKEPKR